MLAFCASLEAKFVWQIFLSLYLKTFHFQLSKFTILKTKTQQRKTSCGSGGIVVCAEIRFRFRGLQQKHRLISVGKDALGLLTFPVTPALRNHLLSPFHQQQLLRGFVPQRNNSVL